jgi:ribosomal protein S3AE
LNPAEEKKRIIRLISHFSLHYHLIKFSVDTEKGQEFSTDFRGLTLSKSKMKVFQLITKLSFDKFTYLPKDAL